MSLFKRTKVCQRCGMMLIGNQTQFCSRGCANKTHMEQMRGVPRSKWGKGKPRKNKEVKEMKGNTSISVSKATAVKIEKAMLKYELKQGRHCSLDEFLANAKLK